jgi:hypothetical protein
MSNPERVTANHRIRELVNGQFVAEERQRSLWLFYCWTAIDMKSPQFLWRPSDQYYKDCIGSRDGALNAIAHRGA